MPLVNQDRINITNNSTDVGRQRIINFIPGTGISFTITNDPSNDRVNTTIQVDSTASVSFASITDSGLAAGKVVYTGTGGLLSVDTNFAWDTTNQRLGIGTTSPNSTFEVQGQSRFYNQNFTYPAGGYTAFQHSPTVSTINEAAPVMRFMSAAPTLTYTAAINMGFGTNSLVNLQPTLQSGGALGSGSDTINYVVFNLIPTFNGTTGPRTCNQFFGIFTQARCSGGTVTTMEGSRIGLSANGGTVTTGYGMRIPSASTSAGGVITTNVGLKIDSQTVGTTNYAIQSEGGQSYHVGALKLGAASAPAATYTLDVAGNITTSLTTFNFSTLTSVSFTNALAQTILFMDASFTKLQQNSVKIEPAAVSGATPNVGLTHTAPAHTTVTASAEVTDVLLNFNRTIQWTSSVVANNRSLKILGPTFGMTGFNTVTEASTVYIDGPPTCDGTAQGTTFFGFKLDTKAVSSNIDTAGGFQINAPTGAFNSNFCGSFLGASVGFGVGSPRQLIHGNDGNTTSSNSIVWNDSTTRYGSYYFGQTPQTSLTSSTGVYTCGIDGGVNMAANTTFGYTLTNNICSIQGAVNYSGTYQSLLARISMQSTAGTIATQNVSNASFVSTTGANAAMTTVRLYHATCNIQGTGTITTLTGHDVLFTPTNVAGTITTTIGHRFQDPVKGASYTMQDIIGYQCDDIATTVTGVKIAYYAKGTNTHNRFVNNTSFGQDATPGATVDINGKLFFDGATGTTTKYNNQTTTGTGQPYLLQSPAVSATKTANFTVFSYTPAATAATYRVQGIITTTSATNTGTVQLTLDYKDSQGTTHTADVIPLTDAAGNTATTKSGASKEFHSLPWLFTVDSSATAIALKVVITGTVSYTVTGTIERVI